jgi:hypothetical protein
MDKAMHWYNPTWLVNEPINGRVRSTQENR